MSVSRGPGQRLYGSEVMGGTSYLGYFVKWMMDVLLAFQEWLSYAAGKMTHDPLWIGITLAVIVGLIVLYMLKRKTTD
jgi:hypothetical protein